MLENLKKLYKKKRYKVLEIDKKKTCLKMVKNVRKGHAVSNIHCILL